MLWLFIFSTVIILAACGLIFLVKRIRGFSFVSAVSNGRRSVEYAISAAAVLVLMLVLYLFLGMVNAIIAILHLVVIWLLTQLLFYLIKKVWSKSVAYDIRGITAVVLTVVYLLYGAFSVYNVRQTDYTVSTEKNVGELKVAALADSHLGTTFDGGFAKHLELIGAQNPDIVVVVGDFVDEGTKKEDMQKACLALGNLKTTYGVFFVFGNHDKGKYSNSKRDFGGDELKAELLKNGVSVLEDETVLIDNRVYLTGRADASEETDFGGSRADMSELTKGLDKEKYWIVLDHQPRDYAAQAKAGADLVLSGHTHGGQLIPIKQITEWTGLGGNDRIYGLEHRGDSDFIVTSGISDWEILFKTGCFSEYVMINIRQNSR